MSIIVNQKHILRLYISIFIYYLVTSTFYSTWWTLHLLGFECLCRKKKILSYVGDEYFPLTRCHWFSVNALSISFEIRLSLCWSSHCHTRCSLLQLVLQTHLSFILVVSQDYLLESHSKSVILGNSAILKCEIPSFVADFVFVTSWIEETSGESYFPGKEFGGQDRCYAGHF